MNLEALRQFWNARAPREQTLLGSAALVAGAALLYAVLVDPAYSSIARLQRALPQSRLQSVQLQTLLAEVRALKARPAVAGAAGSDPATAITQSLAAAGLKANRMVPLANGGLQLTFSDVPYAAWSVWLATAERELGMRAVAVTARATRTPGDADIDLTLRSGHE
jgi:general secretion pathway protein M